VLVTAAVGVEVGVLVAAVVGVGVGAVPVAILYVTSWRAPIVALNEPFWIARAGCAAVLFEASVTYGVATALVGKVAFCSAKVAGTALYDC